MDSKSFPLFLGVKNSTKFVGEKDNLLSTTTTRVGKKENLIPTYCY